MLLVVRQHVKALVGVRFFGEECVGLYKDIAQKSILSTSHVECCARVQERKCHGRDTTAREPPTSSIRSSQQSCAWSVLSFGIAISPIAIVSVQIIEHIGSSIQRVPAFIRWVCFTSLLVDRVVSLT
jgi:hypothetical protein